MIKFKKDYWKEWEPDWDYCEEGYGFTILTNFIKRLDAYNPLLTDCVISESPRDIDLYRIGDGTVPNNIINFEDFPIRTAEADAVAIQWLRDNPEEAWPLFNSEGHHIHPNVSVLCFKETFQDNGYAIAIRYPLAILYKDTDGEFVVSTDIFEEA